MKYLKNNANIWTLIFFVLFVTACFFQKYVPNNSPIDFNVPYHTVRSDIIEQGWQPVVSQIVDTEGFLVQDYRDLGFVEVEDCSGTGLGYCRFVFKNSNGIYLLVTTQEAPLGDVKPKFEETHNAIVIGYSITDEPN